jgi:predicted DCC family thiol-disulfide oxidoreductase YuxK
MPEHERYPHEAIPPCLLIYDAECRLCVATKQKLERSAIGDCTGAVSFIPYQSDQARRVLGSLYRPGPPDMAFLVEPSGTVRQGLDAFLPLAPRMAGGRLLVRLLRLPLARRLAEWGYRTIARHRYRWFGPVSRR